MSKSVAERGCVSAPAAAMNSGTAAAGLRHSRGPVRRRPLPLFGTQAGATLKRVAETFGNRGREYGDTWRNAQWLALKAVLRELGLYEAAPGTARGRSQRDRPYLVTDSLLRCLAAAVLTDVKYQRLEGGYKDDSVIDGIAYQALLAEEMRLMQPGPWQKV